MASLGTFTEDGVVLTVASLITSISTLCTTNGWTELQAPNIGNNYHLVLEAPNGNIIALIEERDDSQNIVNIAIQAYTSFVGGLGFNEEAGHSPKYLIDGEAERENMGTQVTLTDRAMKYWLNVSNSKIFFVVRVANLYVAGYAGSFIKYNTPANYPNAQFVGGNAGGSTDSTSGEFKWDTLPRYSWLDAANSNFPFGCGASINTSSSPRVYHDYVRIADDSWVDIGVDGFQSFRTTVDHGYGYIGTDYNTESAFNFNWGLQKEQGRWVGRNMKNEIEGRCCVLLDNRDAQKTMLGELHSVIVCANQDIIPEDTFLHNGDTYIMFPDVFRDERYDFFAMKLE